MRTVATPDEGVVGQKGLSRDWPERGLGYEVYAEARRANVWVMFWSDSAEITPKAEVTFRYTDTWVLEDDRWRLAVRHASAAPPPLEPQGRNTGPGMRHR